MSAAGTFEKTPKLVFSYMSPWFNFFKASPRDEPKYWALSRRVCEFIPLPSGEREAEGRVRSCDSKLQVPTEQFPVDACAFDPDPSP